MTDIEINMVERWNNLDASVLEHYYTANRPLMHLAKAAPPGFELGIDEFGRKHAIPIKESLIHVVEVLRRVRIQREISLRIGCEYLASKGVIIKTSAGLSKRLDVMEENFGLLTKEERDRRPKNQARESVVQRAAARKAAKEVALDALKEQKDELADMKVEMTKLRKAMATDAKKIAKRAKEAGLNNRELKSIGVKTEESKGPTAPNVPSDAPEAPIADSGPNWIRLYWEAVKDANMPYTELMKLYDSAYEQLKSSDQPILFLPTPRQYQFMAASEDIVLFGGAAGGGKSYVLIFDAIELASSPHMRALIIRRSSGELTELIDKTNTIYPALYPGAKYNQSKMTWTFPSGATLRFGFLEKTSDWQQYIGQPYTYIGFDEVQLQKTPEGFDKLRSRLRSAEGLPCYIRCTANPGGASWVKERFIDPAPSGEPFEDLGLSYKFIQSKLTDNPHLAKSGQYLKMLESLPSEAQRRQLIEGDWDINEDSFFLYNKEDNLIPTGQYPPLSWPIISSLDYGYNDPAACIWASIEPDTGALHVYRELEMIKATAIDWGREILRQEAEANEMYSPSAGRVIDGSLFKMTGHSGPSIREDLHNIGIMCKPADRNREAGWVKVNQLLTSEMLFISEDCVRLLDQINTAVKDEGKTRADDIDQAHGYSFNRRHHFDLLDCLRYLCMSRPNAQRALGGISGASTWERYNSYFS